MRVCPFCATHLSPTEFTCRVCGGKVPDSISAETGAKAESPPTLLGTTATPDVQDARRRFEVEWGFVLGCLGLIIVSIFWLRSWLNGGEQAELAAAIIFFVCSPLAGLAAAVAGCMLGEVLRGAWSLVAGPRLTVPKHTLKKTSSRDRRGRARTNIAPGTPPGNDEGSVTEGGPYPP